MENSGCLDNLAECDILKAKEVHHGNVAEPPFSVCKKPTRKFQVA